MTQNLCNTSIPSIRKFLNYGTTIENYMICSHSPVAIRSTQWSMSHRLIIINSLTETSFRVWVRKWHGFGILATVAGYTIRYGNSIALLDDGCGRKVIACLDAWWYCTILYCTVLYCTAQTNKWGARAVSVFRVQKEWPMNLTIHVSNESLTLEFLHWVVRITFNKNSLCLMPHTPVEY